MDIRTQPAKPFFNKSKIQRSHSQPTQAPHEGRFSKDSMAITATAVTALAGATLAGIGAVSLLPTTALLTKGLNGFQGMLAGAGLGAIAGGATGFGLASSYRTLDSKHSHNAPAENLAASSLGVFIGAVAGGVAGYFGADPLVVAPASVLGGTAGTTAAMYVTGKLGWDS